MIIICEKRELRCAQPSLSLVPFGFHFPLFGCPYPFAGVLVTYPWAFCSAIQSASGVTFLTNCFLVGSGSSGVMSTFSSTP